LVPKEALKDPDNPLSRLLPLGRMGKRRAKLPKQLGFLSWRICLGKRAFKGTILFSCYLLKGDAGFKLGKIQMLHPAMLELLLFG